MLAIYVPTISVRMSKLFCPVFVRTNRHQNFLVNTILDNLVRVETFTDSLMTGQFSIGGEHDWLCFITEFICS